MRLSTLILCAICLFLSGCGLFVYDDSNDKIWFPIYDGRVYSYNGLISLAPPYYENTSFERLITKGGKDVGKRGYDIIVLRRIVQDKIVEKLRFSIEKINEFSSELYLDKDNIEKFRIATEKTKGEFKFSYKTFERAFVSYIDGMQCRTFQNYEYIRGSSTKTRILKTKQFDTYCSFYDEKGEPKTFLASHEYSYVAGNDVFDTFKRDMNDIFSSIKIKMDREKMKKEGLLFKTNSKDIKWK
ncbi:hypothetical protein [Campylobacter sputorum]|uniref:hypothetical protein n=1 Tax=Campylobacter sputorum TaxID=206 RepID=UPI00125F3F9F|nr:hypothetical protein [Campylobacter sputorum]ASM36873.1 hypothetical protein CSF_1005 [Campylobacter sputorum bv. faecalis CCUG 20703]